VVDRDFVLSTDKKFIALKVS